MRTILILHCVIMIFCKSLLFGQLVNNQINYGTYGYDYANTVKLSDGNYLLGCGNGAGISGTKSCDGFGSTDYWIFKMDVNNNIIWQKCFGGSNEDNLTDFAETSDGFVIISGRSNSSISGNKTVGTNGGFDYWVIKIDLNGNEIWQKNYGTSINESSPYVSALSNGQFLITSTSLANIDGDKTELSYGSSDYWLISIDAQGNISWDRTIGGLNNDYLTSRSSYDSINETILVVGTSNSDIGGLKTENSFGNEDLWVVKLDIDGNIIDQKTIGGNNFDNAGHINILENSNVIITSLSNSSISGNKTSVNFGMEDIWIIHLDQDLNIVNDFTYGGDNIDGAHFSSISSDNNLIIGGYSSSNISGNKTELSRGQGDAWILCVNFLNGTILWQKTLGGSLYEWVDFIYDEGTSFKVVSTSESPISGDKTVGTFGDYDFWIFDLSKTVGVSEFVSHSRNLYPNPSSGVFNIDINENETIRLIDIKGLDMEFILESGSLDLNHLQNGTYFLIIESQQRERDVLRLVKVN